MTDQRHLYTELAATGPYEAKIGSALITMVEPHVGHEYSYNRWYEDDHFNAGAMAMPWMFSGRRWVAPKSLQAYRYPADSAIAQPLDASVPSGTLSSVNVGSVHSSFDSAGLYGNM